MTDRKRVKRNPNPPSPSARPAAGDAAIVTNKGVVWSTKRPENPLADDTIAEVKREQFFAKMRAKRFGIPYQPVSRARLRADDKLKIKPNYDLDSAAKLAKNPATTNNTGVVVNKDDLRADAINMASKIAKIIEQHPDIAEDVRRELGATATTAFQENASPRPHPAIRPDRPKWSDKAARKGRNPVQFIRDEYHDELVAGTLSRNSLTRLDFDLASAYASWIRPARHPEDALWPDIDGTRRIDRNATAAMSAEELVTHRRRKDAERQAKFAAKHRVRQ